MESFTRNYEDNSSEAGFQFAFYCDICHDGFKSEFVGSTTYKKGKGLRNLTRGAGILGGLFGGKLGNIGYAAEQSGYELSDRFGDMSPDWRKEHEKALMDAQQEAKKHFHRCHSCHIWVCDQDFNEDEGLCVECAPRQEIYVAKAKSDALKNNINKKAETAKVWSGNLESKTIVCPKCGQPVGKGTFCSNCGTSLSLLICSKCGSEVAIGAHFCAGCGNKIK